jgi:hypothetical protein
MTAAFAGGVAAAAAPLVDGDGDVADGGISVAANRSFSSGSVHELNYYLVTTCT